MKLAIISTLLLAGGFVVGLVVSITVVQHTAPAPHDPALYSTTKIPLTGYKSY